jgi:hypothetical protein
MDNDMERVARLIENIEQDLRALKQILAMEQPGAESGYNADPSYYQAGQSGEQIIEGAFDGERMVDFQGKSYQVSANYASKSKLVEGDPLKLYITRDGKFFYKQLGPVERKTLPGVLRAEGNHYVIDAEDGSTYNVLTASVTYYMSLFGVHVGDKLMIMIPAEIEAHWAVIDNTL